MNNNSVSHCTRSVCKLNVIQNISRILDKQKIYFENCASCHGVKLEGQPNWRKRDAGGYLPAPPHDETGHTWHHSDDYLFMITKFGLEKFLDAPYPNNMPVYASLLSDEEIIAVLSYIKSQWPKTIQRQHDAINTKANM